MRVGFGTGLGVELFQLMTNKGVYVEATVSRFIEAYNMDFIYLLSIYGNSWIYNHLNKKNFSQMLNVNVVLMFIEEIPNTLLLSLHY